MATMTTLFEGYDEEYRSLTSDISNKLSQVSTYENDQDKASSSLKHINNLLDQANQLVQQMELEVRSLDSATRRELGKKVTHYKGSLKNLWDEYDSIREKSERSGLLGSGRAGGSGSGSTSMEQRQQLAQISSKLDGTSDRIEQARRTVAETEEVAVSITDELGRSREKIMASHAKVKEVSQTTDQARKVVSRMGSRERRQRLCVYLAMAVVFCGILLLIYYILFGRR